MSRHLHARLIALAFPALLCISPFAQADPVAEQQIRALISKTYDQPGHLVETSPIVGAGDNAIADWTQGAQGGRALLSRSQGQWEITACGGDGFKEVQTLQANGIAAATAQSLVAQLSKAERGLPAQRVKQFGLFGTPGDPGHADPHAQPHSPASPAQH